MQFLLSSTTGPAVGNKYSRCCDWLKQLLKDLDKFIRHVLAQFKTHVCICCWCNRKWERPSRLLLVQRFWRSLRPNETDSSSPKKRTKELTKGVWSTIERTHFFCVYQFFIIPSGNNIYLIFPIADFGTGSIRGRYRKISTCSPFFLSRQVCVCTILSIRSSHITFSPFISIYGTIWLEVLLCGIQFTKKIIWEKRCRYTVRGGLNFRVSTRMHVFRVYLCSIVAEEYFTTVYSARGSDFRDTYTIRYTSHHSSLEI